MIALTLFECCLVDFILYSLDEMRTSNTNRITNQNFFFVFSSDGGYDKCYLHEINGEEEKVINNIGLLYNFE